MSKVSNLLERFQTDDELQKEFLGIHTFRGGKCAYLFKRNHEIYYLGEEFPDIFGKTEAVASSPRKVNSGGNYGVRAFCVGSYNEVLLDLNGNVFCSGEKDYCGTEIKTSDKYAVPTKVPLPIIKYISCGRTCTLALSARNELFFWGKLFCENSETELHKKPMRIDLPQDVIVQNISAGCSHAAVLDSRGQVYTWGFNDWGQLGHSSNESFIEKPTLLVFPKLFKYVLCGEYSTGFVTVDGKFYVTNGTAEPNNPFQLTEIKECGCVVEIAAYWGLNLFAVRNSNGHVFEWRRDNYCSKPELKRTMYRHVVKVFTNHLTPTIMPISDGDFQGVIKKINWEDFTEDVAEIISNSYVQDQQDTNIDISKLYNDELFSDIKIQLANECVHAHKLILYNKSEYFKKLIDDGSIATVVDMSNWGAVPYKSYIRYLYTGRLEWESLDHIPEIYSIADQDNNEILKEECLKVWRNNLSESNVVPLYQTAYNFRTKNLRDECGPMLRANVAGVMTSDDYKNLPDPIKISIYETAFRQ